MSKVLDIPEDMDIAIYPGLLVDYIVCGNVIFMSPEMAIKICREKL